MESGRFGHRSGKAAAHCLLWLMGGLVVLCGCSAKHYRKSADKEVYGILQQVERQIFGRTNAFTIDTVYSHRDPATILPAEIIADRNATNLRVINLAEALDLAFKNSREYQTRKEQLYLRALTLTGRRYEFGPAFTATSEAAISGSGEGSDVGSVSSQVSVSQLLKSGGKLTAALGNDLVRYFTQFTAGSGGSRSARNTAISFLSVNLSQPLLRGFGINNPAVENLTQAERNVVYEVRSFSLYQQQFAVDTVSAYFRLVTQKDIVRNNYRNYTNRVETTRYLQARAVDRERESNVDDARTAELGARRDYINSLASFLTALDNFKLRLGLPIAEQVYLEDKDLKELIQAGLIPVEVDRDAAFQICLERQMEVLNAIDQFEDSKRKVRIAADQLRADVNFFASGSVESEPPDDYAHFEPQKIRYNAGIRLDLPLDRLLKRNDYRNALINFEAQLRSLALTLDQYKERIDASLRAIEQARLNYLNGVESLRVAERRVENNLMLLEAGRATIRDVRESQDNLINAQNQLANIYASYLADRLGLLVDLGVIDIRPEKFWLLDPLETLLKPEQRGAPPLRMPDDRVLPPQQFLEPAS